MAGLGSPLLLLGLLGLLAPAPSLGKVIHVMMSEDSSEGICPGSMCNLRAAWQVSDLNDTIMLDVNPIMSSSLGPLTSPPAWGTTRYNGTVTITGPKGGAVVRGGNKFISMDSYPFNWRRPGDETWHLAKLVLRNIEFTNFHFTSTANSYTSGMVLCLSCADEWCNIPADASDSPRAGGLRHPQKGDQKAKRALGGEKLLGFEDTQFGNWSLLRQHAMLEIDNCVFRNNSYDSVSNDNSYGSVVAIHSDYSSVTPVIISSSQFMDNTMTGVSSATGMVYGSSGEGYDAVMISDTRFANNNDMTSGNGGLIPGLDGPTIGSNGPISISGSSFVGNMLGGSRAVVSSTFSYLSDVFHVYIWDTIMIDNMGNQQPANDNAAAVIAGWLVMEGVTLSLPASAPLTATYIANDQYMDACAVRSASGKPVLFTGYQVFNRNPVFTNADNGTTTLGFADCSQAAPWLPCRKGTICSNAHNPTGGVVGYTCA